MPQVSRIDGHTLSWVKSEIDSTMKNARQALENYVETPDDESQLRFCLNYLHQVYGTLQMVELYGAGMLASELEALTQSLIDNEVKNRNDAYEVMMRGMMQLPDYLEKLQQGQHDYPIILLPLLNDLRAARSAALLSESALFSPNLEVEAPIPIESVEESIDTLARQLRHAYHLGLLDWFRNSDVKTGLKRISAVIDKLRPAANDPDTSRMLWAASGVVEALREKGIESSIAVKLLMGQLDRQFKKIIDRGEFALSTEPPRDLLKNLLYYVASSNSEGTRVSELKNAFQLTEVMPDTETLERARADLSAPNAALMRTVSSVLMEDLTQVKDNLDVFVRSEERDPQTLVALSEKLTQMGDTLDMLGFGDQRMVLQDQVKIINGIAKGEKDFDEAALMDVAGSLLSIETALGEPTSTHAGEQMEEEDASDDSIIRQFGDPEQRKLVKRVVAEVKVDLTNIKDAFNDYNRAPKNVSILKDVPGLLDRIRGSLMMLTLDRAAAILLSTSDYIANRVLNTTNRPQVRTLELLADTISSVEYYLESLTESWGHPTAILDVAENSLRELGITPGEQVTIMTDAVEPDANDEVDQTLVDLASPSLEEDEPGDNDQTMEMAVDDGAGLSLEGFDNEEEALSSDSIPQPLMTDHQAPDEEGSISQQFDLPDVEARAEVEDESGSEMELAESSIDTEPSTQPIQQDVSPAPPSSTNIVDELDDEIVEIFLEEAEEEHANISRLLPAWQNNPQDEESLKELRRSFHTLKGSGRLVGAADVGEFAWAYENMLNRVIDRTIETSPQMFELLEQGRQTLPALLEYFRNGEKPDKHVFSLMETAESISRGENVDLSDTFVDIDQPNAMLQDEVSEAADEQSSDLSMDPGLEEETEGSEVGPAEQDSMIDLSANLPEEEPLETSQEQVTVEPVDVDDTLVLELEGVLDQDEPSREIEFTYSEPKGAPTIDPVLLGIYRKEIATHLSGLHEYIYEWRHNDMHKASHNLVRALHTLKGSSRTASVPQVAELCNFLEEHAKYLQDHNFDVDADMVALLEDSASFIERTVELLDKDDAVLPDNAELIKRTRILLDRTRYESPTMQIELPQTLAQIDLDEVSEESSDGEQNVDILGGTDSPSLIEGTEDDNQVMESAVQEELPDYDEELLEIFLEEGVEILDESDHTLHDWIAEPESMEHVKALQRQLHTLKGGARMAGVIEIGDLSHAIETMLTAIVDDNLDVAEEMFGVLQKSQDALVKMLETVRQQQHPQPANTLIDALNALAKGQSINALDTATVEEPVVEEEPTLSADISEETPEPEINIDVTQEDPLLDGLSEQAFDPVPVLQTELEGNDNVIPLAGNQAVVEAEQPGEIEETTEQPKQAQQRGRGEVIRVRSDLLDNLVNFAGEVSIYRSRMEQQTNAFRYNLSELDDTVERFREQLRNFEIEAEAQIQYRIEESGGAHEDFDPLEFDRFTQMQTLSRGMMESLNDFDSLRGILTNLTRESETLLLQQSRVNTELQEGLMRTRMVPVSGQIPRLRRIVRQTSEELGKKVELHIQGADNELDRTVLERVMSPIEHMLRNAVAHGIEAPQERATNGKDETGNIMLSFAREGSDVVITISDDGAGINLEAIRAKAIERGIIKPTSIVRKDDLLDIILESGFSTAEEVTQISGRGVGMDVVNSEIKQLGGLLDIKTELGKGTAFQINMPLSLSVTRALMVNVGDEMYAIPLLGVETVERVSREEIIRMQSEKNGSYHWLDNEFRYIHLGETMGMTEAHVPSEDVNKLPILLVRSGDYRAAIHVDGLIGSREIVVKPVGPQLSTLRGISGATVMGDGSVVLILDLGVLIRLAGTAHEAGVMEQVAEQDQFPEPAVEEKRTPVIMVVDDSITVRKVTTRLLERNDYKTVSAKDGVDALAQLQEIKPDVMLLDVEMPRMDGFELATNIRNDDVLKDIPIIMITSRTGQKHRDRAMKIGVNIYMGKPYSEGELLDNIITMLGQRE